MMPENLRALWAGWLWRDRRAVKKPRCPAFTGFFGSGGDGCCWPLLFLLMFAKVEEAVRLFWGRRRWRRLIFLKKIE